LEAEEAHLRDELGAMRLQLEGRTVELRSAQAAQARAEAARIVDVEEVREAEVSE
jgi:hypothetical protein